MHINGLPSAQTAGISGIGDILARLVAGDVIKAKILEFIDGELLLKLFDGTVFKAEASDNIDAKTGDTLKLMVGNKEGGKLYMKIIKDNVAADFAESTFYDTSNITENSSGIENEPEIKALLKKIDLPADKTNIGTAYHLKASGNSVTNEVVKNAAKIISTFSQLSSGNSAFLASKDITPTQENILSMLNLLNGKLKLGNELDTLRQQLSKIVGDITKLSDNQAAIHTKTGNTVESIEVKPSGMNKIENNEAGLIVNTEANFIKIDTNKSEFTKSGYIGPDVNGADLNMANGSGLKSSNIKDLIYVLKATIEESHDLFVKINTSENDIVEQKSEIKNLLVNIKDKLENLEKQISELKTHVTQIRDLNKDSGVVSLNAGNLINLLDSVQDNLRVLNEVGKNTYYVQLPLNLSGYDTTAELYVMKRGSKKTKLDPENTVLFISLDTFNIGNVQSIIEIKGKEVAINLRVESPQIMEFMKENTTSLHKRLSEEGFKLSTASFRLISNTTALSEIEKTVNEELNLRHKVMDVKI